MNTLYCSFKDGGIGVNEWGGKDVLCYTVGESLEALVYAGWRSYLVASFSAEFFEVHQDRKSVV